MWIRSGLAALLLAAPASAERISDARYDGPTTIYDHGILGDAVEWSILVLRLADGAEVSVRWDSPMLFEDTAPRVVDLDGDGSDEVIVVETHLERGARLAVWGVEDGQPVQRVATPFIGQSNRWLAPAAWGDLDGDGAGEIAYVDRPHLLRKLRILRYRRDGNGAGLEPVAEVDGVTNHRIGDREISGGLRACDAVPELVLLSPDWSRVVVLRLPGLVTRDLGPNGPGAVERALTCR